MASRTPSPTSPQDALGYLVKHAYHRLTVLSDTALAPLGIDSRDYGVLRALVGEGPMSQQDVAAKLRLDRTTMVARIDGLEAKRMVSRRPDPVDRRRNAVELTEHGLDVYRKAEAAYTAAEKEFLAPLSQSAAAQFRRALRALVVID